MKAKSIALTALVLPVVAFTGIAGAASEGQIEGGDIYRVRNVTKNTDFTDPASADKCEVVQFKVRIHNPGPGGLTSVTVRASLPTAAATTHTSTVEVSAINADPSYTTDTASVNLSSAQGIKYVNGSTQLLDAHNGFIKNLPDGITASGVNIGNVGVSTEEKRYVQFQAKVDCPTPPVTPPTTPPTTPTNPVAPKELPKTGAGDVVAVVAGATILGAIAHRLFTSRRLGSR